MKDGRRKLLMWALLGGGLLARAGYAAYVAYGKHRTKWAENELDPDKYDQMARHLLEFGELSIVRGQPTTEREPFYSLLLALVHLIFGPAPWLGIALNVVLGTVTCWLMYELTRRVFDDEQAGLLALAISAFFPEWIYFGAVMYRETLLGTMTVLWGVLWARDAGRGDPKLFAAMGLLFGGIALTRSPMIPVGAAFLLLAASKLRPRQWARTLLPFAVCAALTQVPWVWRNYNLTGRLVAGSSIGGSVMYMSLLFDYDRPERAFEEPLNSDADPVMAEFRHSGKTLSEAEPMFYAAVRRVLVEDPGRFLYAFWRKALKLWRLYPSADWDYRHSKALFAAVGLVSGGGVLLLGLIGAVLAWRDRKPIGFLLLVPAVMTAVYGLFWAVARYHSPLMFGPIALAAYSLRKCWMTAVRMSSRFALGR